MLLPTILPALLLLTPSLIGLAFIQLLLDSINLISPILTDPLVILKSLKLFFPSNPLKLQDLMIYTHISFNPNETQWVYQFLSIVMLSSIIKPFLLP